MIQTIDLKGITKEKLLEIIDKLGFDKNIEFAKYYNINKSSVSDWVNGRIAIPKNFKIALYYIEQYLQQKKEIERLKEQLQISNDASNQTELLTNFNELKKEVDQLSKQMKDITKELKEVKQNKQ